MNRQSSQTLAGAIQTRRRGSERFTWILVLAATATLFAAGAALVLRESRAEPTRNPATNPGLIVGRWQATCENSQGMVIELKRRGTRQAIGTVHRLGKASQFGYKVGQTVLYLHLVQGGAWDGRLRWRNTAGHERWDPIQFRLMNANTLHGVTRMDYCFEQMPRAR